jgi:hypothetical protein
LIAAAEKAGPAFGLTLSNGVIDLTHARIACARIEPTPGRGDEGQAAS